MRGGVAKAVPPRFFCPASKRGATPHHRPLPVEGRPQPTRLRSVARTARRPPRPAHESDTHGHVRRSGCVSLSGSGQPAPPACRARLRPAGCAVCPSRRSHTRAAPSAPRGASHTQPPLWARPDGRSSCAGRVGSSRRRALRYGRRAAALLARPRAVVGCGIRSRPPRRAPASASGNSERDSGARVAVTRPRVASATPARPAAAAEAAPEALAPAARTRAPAPAERARSRAPSAPGPTPCPPARQPPPRPPGRRPRPRRTTCTGTPTAPSVPRPPPPCPAACRSPCPR